MRTKKPTAVREDYLRALFLLRERSGAAKLVAIARYLKLSRSTVSERMQELARDGYIRHTKYSSVSFTRRGYAVAKQLTHKHRLIEVFLHTVLQLSKKASHEEAHRLEHAVSNRVIKKIRVLLGNPTTDPHGMKIPAL